MPGPYRAAAGKPRGVRKRPRRGQDPSLRTDPSTGARPYSVYMNYTRRAGCPHPAASSRSHPSQRAATHVGRAASPTPRKPPAATNIPGGINPSPTTNPSATASRHRPSPGKPPGRACPAPTARRRATSMPSANARGGVKTPPYGPSHQRVPGPYRAAVQ